MALGQIPRKLDQQCRSRGCFQLARWKCMVLMPTPPGIDFDKAPAGLIVKDGARARLFSGVCVCDRHKADATVTQVLGPVGYPAICAAFRAMKKQPPSLGDLGIDFESLEYSPILDA